MTMKLIFATFALSVAGAGQAAVLYDNGPVVNGSGLSIIEGGGSLLGAGAQSTVPNIVADNFSVSGSSWNVASLDFYSYQTSATTFTFTTATWSILSGGITGAVVASGTTAVTDGGFMGYRVSPTTLTDTTRRIYRLSADIPDLVLAAGNYMLTWTLAGTGASGPWVTPTLGSVGTGNAYQSAGGAAFAPLIDTGNSLTYDLTFSINGTVVTTTPGVPEPASWAMMIGGLGLVGASMRRRRAMLSFA